MGVFKFNYSRFWSFRRLWKKTRQNESNSDSKI